MDSQMIDEAAAKTALTIPIHAGALSGDFFTDVATIRTNQYSQTSVLHNVSSEGSIALPSEPSRRSNGSCKIKMERNKPAAIFEYRNNFSIVIGFLTVKCRQKNRESV